MVATLVATFRRAWANEVEPLLAELELEAGAGEGFGADGDRDGGAARGGGDRDGVGAGAGGSEAAARAGEAGAPRDSGRQPAGGETAEPGAARQSSREASGAAAAGADEAAGASPVGQGAAGAERSGRPAAGRQGAGTAAAAEPSARSATAAEAAGAPGAAADPQAPPPDEPVRAPARQRPRRSVRELVTLASLVEKEARIEGERPQIAAVYANRLELGMGLYADPTVVYALKQEGRWDGNIRRQDLRMDSPYNTYRHAGLPPGPIASPGLASLKAAARPADITSLYFVSRNDGTHVFADTLAEHNRNVDRWQRQYWREQRRREAAAAPRADERQVERE
jgi:hypothetical protein